MTVIALTIISSTHMLAALVLVLVLAAIVGGQKPTLTDSLERYFRQHPHQEIDSWVILRLAGHGGWRARISDCRNRGMRIENRIWRKWCDDGITRTFSSYTFIPAAPANLLEIAEQPDQEQPCL